MLSSFLSLLAADYRILPPLDKFLGMPLELLLPVILAIVAIIAGIMYGKSIRMEDHGWRIGLIAASFLASLAIILFWEYKLGVDLKGGAILVYEVDEKATADNHPQGRKDDWQMNELLQVLKRRLNPDGLKEIVIRPFGPKQVEIVIPEVDADEIEATKEKVSQAGILRFLILADSPTRDQALWDAARSQALDATTQAEQLDRNVLDPTDPKGERIIGFWADVKRKPGTAEPQDFAEPSTITGSVLLRDGDTGQVIDLLQRPADMDDFRRDPVQYFHRRQIKNVQVLMAVDPEIDIRGSDLAVTTEGMDQSGRPCINFVMKGDSIWKMSETTGNNRPVGATTRKLGIIWDNVLESAPSIQSQISQRGEITGDFSREEVREKVELLRSGSMPVVLQKEPISDDRIGATLGADTVRKGSQSIIISLAVVLGFVLIYYRTAGVIACFALLLNVMLTVALMFALKAPFTLPGLAGLVLTVGMSVDANVLIYERLREELEKGASLRMAIRNGFDKALVTIIDSNVTTLLTAVILYVIGTDQVRGFGMTLILGIVTSMFTAIFASRAILEVGERAYRWQTLEMMKFFTQTHIDWMGAFRPAAIASVIVIVVGLAATVARGRGILDTDLAGGTSVQFALNREIYPEITEAQVRERVAKAFEGVHVTKTNAKADYNVYQTFEAASDTAKGDSKQAESIWKVDSSLEEVKELQDVVRKAFRTEDGREGIQTYGLKIGEIKELPAEQPAGPVVQPPPAVGAPSTDKPGTDTPKIDTPKVEGPKLDAPETEPSKTKTPQTKTPQTETPKADLPKDETPKANEPKDAPAKKDEEGKTEENQDGSACQPAEEDKKDDEAKSQSKSEDKKSDDKKAEDKKGEEPKTEPAPADSTKPEPKTETPKTETPKTETPKTETTKPETPTDPAAQIPAADPVVPAQPAPTSTVRTQVQLHLGNTEISGQTLQERIRNIGDQVLNRTVLADLSTPGWNGRDTTSYADWTVTLPLGQEDATKVLTQLEEELSKEPVWQTSSKIGGQVAGDTQYRALFAIVGSIIGMIIYMWIRFHKISWGIAAAVALAHDALVMLGAIAVSYWLAPALGFLQVEEFKISLPVVAAFLTLIGYSINDTIVIFDRVREIRGKSPDITGQMVNDAVNQTLSRTIITAGTTLVVIVILYFLGGSGIHAFAFSLVVGVISGSYSTVFIASPLLVYLIGLDQQDGRKKVTSPTTSGTTARGAA